MHAPLDRRALRAAPFRIPGPAAVSFSGGRTSGMMLKGVIDAYGGKLPQDVVVAFMNTGQEDERTLRFVDRCASEWGVDIVWLEAVVDPRRGKGTGHRVVTFETATRDGSIFQSMIEKFGIPNKNYPHCTRELKLRPFTSYIRSIGWQTGRHLTAIGIRADELDRVSPAYWELGLIYPLLDARIRKVDVLRFWNEQPFDLEAPEHYGNCVWCWKKSLRKHLTLAFENPALFDFPRRMERTLGNAGSGEGERVFFRGRRSAADIVAIAADGDFEPFVDPRELDVAGSCSESCEVFAAEDGQIEW